MILLDTNVVSEMMRPAPEPRVETWMASAVAVELFLSSVSEAELRYGIAILASGRRRQALQSAFEDMLREDFSGRVLPFDSAAAGAYAEISAERRRIGRPITQFDAQIAAIARSRGAALATRNVTDFGGCGIALIDPWQG